ncbi:MAG: hypothetical protein MUO31_13425 [Thermodesulfovibrionales bacterium]|nr:hypothetical protein [Thermodesulfovibrionales bacterium]
MKCKFVILNPSHVILSAAKNLVVNLRTGSAKNLAVWLRINSVKNLIRSMCCKTEILRLGPQNDIPTHKNTSTDTRWIRRIMDLPDLLRISRHLI